MQRMQEMQERIQNSLRDAVLNYDVDAATKAAQEAVEVGVDPVKAIEDGLAKGMKIVGDRFGAGDAFLTELMVAAEAMKQAMVVLKPAISKSAKKLKEPLGKVVIGTVEGDIHDIGKNLVGTMLTVAGFEVIDLGADVPTEKFIEKTREIRPDILGMSALLTTTMGKMGEVIRTLEKEGLRGDVKVLVGGAPVSQEWAREIGADGYATEALEAVEVARENLTKAVSH